MAFEIPDDPGLRDKVAIIAGGGAADPNGIGNGRAAAILLANAGTKVLVVDGGVTLQAPERESRNE